MAPTLTPQVTLVKENPVIDPLGKVTRFIRVTFVVGDHGPFSLDFAPADFNTANVQKAMNDKAAVIRGIGGS